MSEKDKWDQIQKTINQMEQIADRHVSFSVSVRTQPNGQIYVDLGRFGNGTLNTSGETSIFLSGILMGMNINRG